MALNPRYELSVEIHHRIEALYPRFEAHGATLRGPQRVSDVFPIPPEMSPPWTTTDPMVCALAIKAATTKQAILRLCDAGDGDNAMALARVLLENAALLEWLLRDKGRVRLDAYALFLSVVHERVVAMLHRHAARYLAAGGESLPESSPHHRAVWKHVFGDTTRDRPTWEFDPATKKGRYVTVAGVLREVVNTTGSGTPSFEQEAVYGSMGSDIIHSGPFDTLKVQRLIRGGAFFLRPIPLPDYRTIALATSNTAMVLVLEAYSQFIGLDLAEELDALKTGMKIDPGDGTADDDAAKPPTSGNNLRPRET